METKSTLLLASLILSVATVLAQPVLFAGVGSSGYSGDGGQAAQAELSLISGFTGDAAGNIYISDGGNMDIRKINAAGIISTYAGNQIGGYSGDGGAATVASINQTTQLTQYNGGMALDAAGNMYINDHNNFRIRKVTLGGIITTVAGTGIAGNSGNGGVATAADIFVRSMAVDPAGNIYFSDDGGNVIRKINTSGIITIVAGVGISGYSGDGGLAINARFNSPGDIAIDALGNLFVSDINNYVIRKINAAGIISTYAGTGILGHSGDGGIATAAKIGANFYVGVATMPLTFNSANELYFTSVSDNLITLRKVSSAGIISTVYDTSYFAFNGTYVASLNAIYIDAHNSFYFSTDDNTCQGFIQPASLYSMSLPREVTTGIAKSAEQNNSVKLFPCPSHGTFTVETNEEENQQITLFDVTGKLVFNQTLVNKTTNIDTKDLPVGTYNVEIRGKENTFIKKMIIEK